MFFEKFCIEFNCYISDKDIWGSWDQCSIDGTIYWRFSYYRDKKYGCRFPTNPLWLYHVYLYKWVVESQ